MAIRKDPTARRDLEALVNAVRAQRVTYSEVLHIRLLPEESEMLAELANVTDLGKSELVRYGIRQLYAQAQQIPRAGKPDRRTAASKRKARR